MIIYINNIDKTSELTDYTFSFGLNDVPKLSLKMTMPLALNDTVKLVDGAKTLFNGFIDVKPIVDYDTQINETVAYGNISKLANVRSNERRNWDNANITTIVPEVVGDIFTINTVDSFSPVSVTDEFASPLLTLTKLALACRSTSNKVNGNVISSYDFWVDEDSDEFYFKTYRGNLLSVASYVINTDIWNVKDVPSDQSSIVNSIMVTGAGDGVNQIVRHSGNLYGELSHDILATGNIVLQVTKDFFYDWGDVAEQTYKEDLPNTIYQGVKIKIGDEIMGIIEGNADEDLFEIYVNDDQRGLDGTTRAAHFTGDKILGGSVLEHGLRQKTYYDRSTIDSDTAYKIAASAVIELSTDKSTMTFNIDTIADFWLGDVITIDSTEYRVLIIDTGLMVGFYTVTVGYISRGQISQYENIIMKLTDGSVYAQGATNIYSVQDSDNCDLTHPLEIKFYIPPEAVRINHVKLNFTLENFRSYSGNVDAASATVGTTESGGSSSPTSADEVIDYDWNSEVNTFNIAPGASAYAYGHIDSVSGIMSYALAEWSLNGQFTVHDASSLTVQLEYYDVGWFTVDTKTHYTQNTYSSSIPLAYSCAGGSIITDSGAETDDIRLKVTNNSASATYKGSSHITTQTYSQHTHNVSIASHTHNVTIPAHNHALVHGIYEEALVDPITSVFVDGTYLGNASTDITNLDIGDWITTTGWHTVTFAPNKRMRLNANIYIQVYIESK